MLAGGPAFAVDARAAPEGDGADVLAGWLNALSTYAASFRQERFDEYGALLESAEGRVYIRRPGRFRWAYEAPYVQAIVTDGQTLWIYDEDLEQVTVNDVAETTAGSPAELLVDGADVRERYDIEALAPGEGLDWFRLTPHGDARDFRSIELGVADGVVRGMRLVDNLGQRTVLRFEDVEEGVALADDLFEFEPPPGVDVIEGTAP